MELKWEEFEEGPENQTGEHLHVTLNRFGNLYLNGKTLEAMGEPDAVVMLFEPRQRVIGIKCAPIGKHNAYRLRRKDRDRTQGRVLYVANFFRRHHIKPDKTFAFVGPKVDDNGVLILNLQTVRPAGRNRER